MDLGFSAQPCGHLSVFHCERVLTVCDCVDFMGADRALEPWTFPNSALQNLTTRHPCQGPTASYRDTTASILASGKIFAKCFFMHTAFGMPTSSRTAVACLFSEDTVTFPSTTTRQQSKSSIS
eukprot:1183998-Prorocentrum_minimum.AAC.4